MVEADEDAKTGIQCRTTDEWGQEDQKNLEGTMTTNGEEADAGIGSMTSEGIRRTQYYHSWTKGQACIRTSRNMTVG